MSDFVITVNSTVDVPKEWLEERKVGHGQPYCVWQSTVPCLKSGCIGRNAF